MNDYVIYFTDSRWSFEVEIVGASTEEQAIEWFEEAYPRMYIERIEKIKY